MSRKSRFLPRKGITPVIATVLLMTISIAAAASAYQFITTAQEQTAENIQGQLEDEELQERSDFNIEYAYEGSNGNVIMSIRNTGSISLELEEDGSKVWSLYVDGAPQGQNGKGWTYHNPNPPDILDPSEVVSIDTNEPFPSQGNEKSFRLTGQHGIRDSHVCYNSGENSC